jgi:hypothetical protein
VGDEFIKELRKGIVAGDGNAPQSDTSEPDGKAAGFLARNSFRLALCAAVVSALWAGQKYITGNSPDFLKNQINVASVEARCANGWQNAAENADQLFCALSQDPKLFCKIDEKMALVRLILRHNKDVEDAKVREKGIADMRAGSPSAESLALLEGIRQHGAKAGLAFNRYYALTNDPNATEEQRSAAEAEMMRHVNRVNQEIMALPSGINPEIDQRQKWLAWSFDDDVEAAKKSYNVRNPQASSSANADELRRAARVIVESGALSASDLGPTRPEWWPEDAVAQTAGLCA